jgi:hypothetical protein
VHLRSVVRRVQQSDPTATVVLVAADGGLPDGGRLDVDGTAWRVLLARSVLAVHEALDAQSLGGPDDRLLVLTAVAERELGWDVLARVARRRVHHLQPSTLLAEAFRARAIDPRLVRIPAVVEYLLDHIPPGGYPPVVAGLLDLDTGWRHVFEQALGLSSATPDAAQLLRWSLGSQAARWAGLPAELQGAIVERLSSTGGALVGAIGQALNGGRAGQLVALGLVLDVLWPSGGGSPPNLAEVVASRVRLEPLLGGLQPREEVARRWADTAMRVLEDEGALTSSARALPARVAEHRAAGLSGASQGSPPVSAQVLQQASQLLTEIRADALMAASDHLPAALVQRGTALAAALRAAMVDASALSSVHAALDRFLAHRSLAAEPERRLRAEHATRAVRALHRSADLGGAGFANLVRRYHREDSWLDQARTALMGGEPIGELADAYRLVLERARDQREALNASFARLLVQWNQQPTAFPGAVPVEHVLDRVVGPLAESRPVLVVLMDGLDVGTARQLVGDAVQMGWGAWEPAAGSMVAISTLPSITAAARASLFAGRVVRGSQHTEKEDFARHPALRRASLGGELPVLFHKSDLGTGNILGEELRSAVHNPRRRVIGAVINAIDDWLDRSDQTLPRWSLSAIPLLNALLAEAAEANRLVVVLSDHGHLLDSDTAVHTPAESARWRVASMAGQGEVHATGARVQAATGEPGIVLPWSEGLRYTGKRTGYHGGASPQEVLAPVAVLARDEVAVAGWRIAIDPEPVWWSLQEFTGAVPQSGPVAIPSTASARRAAEQPAVTAPDGPAWIATLLQSGRYADQRAMAGRVAPADAQVEALLRLLDRVGGRVPVASVAPALGIAPVRVRGVIAGIRRILNVEGYTVLDEDAGDTLTINRQLLFTQFGIGES